KASADERVIHGVTGGADGADRIAFAARIERFAQPAHMHVDCSRFDVNIRAPDGVEQLLPAEDAAGMLDQVIENFEFGGTEMNIVPGAPHAVCRAIHLDVADADNIL